MCTINNQKIGINMFIQSKMYVCDDIHNNIKNIFEIKPKENYNVVILNKVIYYVFSTSLLVLREYFP